MKWAVLVVRGQWPVGSNLNGTVVETGTGRLPCSRPDANLSTHSRTNPAQAVCLS